MSDVPNAYPLSWPIGRPRTPWIERQYPRFGELKMNYTASSAFLRKSDLSLPTARNRLDAEVERLGATNVILSTNLELRADGQPRGDRKAPADPGVALYFKYKDVATVLACDRFTTVAGNIAAIAAHIEGMRKAERHGVGSLEQMFRGFTALSSGLAPMDWRAILGDCKTRAEAEDRYRRRIKTEHPDVGGSEVRAAQLNAAIDLARKHFGGGA